MQGSVRLWLALKRGFNMNYSQFIVPDSYIVKRQKSFEARISLNSFYVWYRVLKISNQWNRAVKRPIEKEKSNLFIAILRSIHVNLCLKIKSGSILSFTGQAIKNFCRIWTYRFENTIFAIWFQILLTSYFNQTFERC